MNAIRIALAQINATVGDLSGNAKKILANIRAARSKGADVVVFPELAITVNVNGDVPQRDTLIL